MTAARRCGISHGAFGTGSSRKRRDRLPGVSAGCEAGQIPGVEAGPVSVAQFHVCMANFRAVYTNILQRWRHGPAPARAQRAHADHEAISEAEPGRRFPRAIEDQQLLLDENGLGHHGSGAAGAGEPRDRRQQMEKQDGQIADDPHRNKLAKSTNAKKFGIRHAQGGATQPCGMQRRPNAVGLSPRAARPSQRSVAHQSTRRLMA